MKSEEVSLCRLNEVPKTSTQKLQPWEWLIGTTRKSSCTFPWHNSNPRTQLSIILSLFQYFSRPHRHQPFSNARFIKKLTRARARARRHNVSHDYQLDQQAIHTIAVFSSPTAPSLSQPSIRSSVANIRLPYSARRNNAS